MGIDRRTTLLRLGSSGLALALASCAGFPGAPSTYTIGQAQLEEALRRKMPLHQSLADVVDLDARLAGLRLLPESNRLAAQMRFQASGPLLPQTWYGSFDLLFGLRWDPADQSLRGHDLELRSLHLPFVAGRSAQLLEAALSALVRQLGEDIVLHRPSPRTLERMHAWGLRPDEVTVTGQGVVLHFVPVR